ncbi:MAG: ACT domain-containing protein [Deltaproteobacteria bacterium]|nr:ACT domain-containing protein [Deltaproteobacteria bacterium]MCW9049894.1 ACT domain-containing protein [Deltaproteobacteria bacterium]
MEGIIALDELLKSMSPEIQSGEYVFCTVEGSYADYADLKPLATFMESEGLTLILPVAAAEKAQLSYDSTFKQITLTIHSSLDAVGLTAAVSTKLADYGISANVVAASYHDHIFVQSEKADEALVALKELSDVD